MTSQFRSVKIFHDIIHRADFSYLSEFFRFMGILVCEEILVEDQSDVTDAEKNTDYSAYICVGRREIGVAEEKVLNGACSVKEYARRISMLPKNTVYLYDEPQLVNVMHPGLAGTASFPEVVVGHLPPDTQIDILNQLLAQILGLITWWEPSDSIGISQFNALIEIYVAHDLWVHSMNMQYYAKRSSCAIVAARTAFLDSHNDVKKFLENGQMQSAEYLYRYAMLWCEVKTNNACDYNDQILYFTKDKLADRCRELCKKYPDFSNAKVLLGLCYEPRVNCAHEALAAFQMALEDMKWECFGSAVYYWVGKRYEQYPETKIYAERSYESANKRKVKFRNYFKLGIMAWTFYYSNLQKFYI